MKKKGGGDIHTRLKGRRREKIYYQITRCKKRGNLRSALEVREKNRGGKKGKKTLNVAFASLLRKAII